MSAETHPMSAMECHHEDLAVSPNRPPKTRSRAEIIAHLERCNETDRAMIAGRVRWCQEALDRIERRNAQIAALREGTA